MKQSDLLIGEKNAERDNSPEVANCPISANCKITEQSAVRGSQHKESCFSVEKLISPGASVEGQKMGNKREGGGTRRTGVWSGKEAVFLSVQTFLQKNIPQVQLLLWSTKLPNVLISAANAAGEQEDGV